MYLWGLLKIKNKMKEWEKDRKKKTKTKKGKSNGGTKLKKDRKEEKLIITLTEKRYMHCSEV